MKTSVGQVTVVDGRRYEQAANTLAEEGPPRQARERGALYVLVELPNRQAGQTDEFARQLIQAVKQAYYGWHGSVTAGLQHAIRDVNRQLFEENRNSLPGERRTAGIACAVLRGADLFLALAGPAVVFARHADQLVRFPELSPWIENVSLEEMDAAPLGDRAEARITLFHQPLDSGDGFLLSETCAARCISHPVWHTVLDRAPNGSGAMIDALVGASHGCDLTALAVAMSDGQPHERRVVAPAEDAAALPRPSQPAGPMVPERAAKAVQTAGSRAWSGLRAVLAILWGGLVSLLHRMTPGQHVPGEQVTVASSTPAVRRRAERPDQRAGRPAGRLAGRGPTPPAVRAAQSDPLQKLLIGLAIAIPLIVAAVVIVVSFQRGQTRRAEVDVLWQQAQEGWKQGETGEAAFARPHLVRAQAALDQLLERDPDRAEAVELRTKVVARLDDINKVRRIRWVGELNSYPADAQLSRVVVQGMHVFVLDHKGARVYHHQLDTSQQAIEADSRARVLVAKGQQVGGVLVGDLVDMVWMTVDLGNVRQRPTLVILESGGNLIEFDPTTGELNALPLAGRETWQYPELVGSHTGWFYLLDTGAGEIWRYPPTPEGYTAAPDEWLEATVDLTGVLDMAVGDGIYLTYADGQIRKLKQGQPAEFSVADWDQPPKAPVALSAYPPDETEWVYVADAGNARIVQSTLEGKFARQFRLADTGPGGQADAMAGITSLFVDESVDRAYFTSGNKLYLVILPE